MKRKLVYIASPYTVGNKLDNVNKSFDVAIELIKRGFAPYAPLYSHYLEERNNFPYETWMDLDMVWLMKCDCVLRLPGESKGADTEVKFALACGVIPVYYSIDEIPT